jgi:hypothetical protein
MKKTRVASGGENVIDPKFFNLVSQIAHFSTMVSVWFPPYLQSVSNSRS